MMQSLTHTLPDDVDLLIVSVNSLLVEKGYTARGFSRPLMNLIASSVLFICMIGSTGPNISSCITASFDVTLVMMVGEM